MTNLSTLSKFFSDKATVIAALERWSAQLNQVIDLYETAPVMRPPLKLVYRPSRFKHMHELEEGFNDLEFLLETYADLLETVERKLRSLDSYSSWDWVNEDELEARIARRAKEQEEEENAFDYEAYEHMYTRNMRT